jgi:carboxyl-terminal processing protease
LIDTISTERERSRTVWFGFFFFASVTALTVLSTIAHSNHRAGVEVCELIRDNYFLVRCFREASSESLTLSRKRAIGRINRRLSGMRTSHLSVYSPVENRQLWTNAGLDTGIRARRIDGEIVVHRLLPESPALEAGVKLGDAIVSIDGETVDDDDVESTAGIYKIARGHQIILFEIGVEDLSEDRGPVLEGREGGVGILRFGSFLAHYFDGERWSEIARRLSRYRGLVIDVRGNAGGSFPASVRALSPFFCEPKIVGSLWTSAGDRDSLAPKDLPDDLDARAQVAALNATGRLNLRTYSGYGCFQGPVTVLVDAETSSVAEIFSEAMKSRKNARVWGVPTAGQVVMARWFEIGSLGGGDYAMSIPIAGYETSARRKLEDDGVDPQRILIYDLEKALRGRDNWMEEAITSVSF